MPSKYRAVHCREQYRDCPTGHASLREHRRWCELVLMEKAGEIRNLQQHRTVSLTRVFWMNRYEVRGKFHLAVMQGDGVLEINNPLVMWIGYGY